MSSIMGRVRRSVKPPDTFKAESSHEANLIMMRESEGAAGRDGVVGGSGGGRKDAGTFSLASSASESDNDGKSTKKGGCRLFNEPGEIE